MVFIGTTAGISSRTALIPIFVRSCYYLTYMVTLTTNLGLDPRRLGGPIGTDGLPPIIFAVSDMRLDMARILTSCWDRVVS